jgi:two-component system, LytTR family, response regulator LytT
MQIRNYNRAAEDKRLEAVPSEIAQRSIAGIGKCGDPEEQLSQSPKPEVNEVESSVKMIRTVIIEESAVAVEQLLKVLGDFQQVKIIGVATAGGAGLELCNELCPDAVFLDINLSDQAGILLATRLAALQDAPRLVFTANSSARAAYAFRLEAVHYLIKPLDRLQISEAINRLLVQLQPIEFGSLIGFSNAVLPLETVVFSDSSHELLPVTSVDRDQIRLLARHEIVAVLRWKRRAWIHTVLEEFPTYYLLAQLMRWLKGEPFIQVGRHAIVNLRGIQQLWRQSGRLYRLRLHDRTGTVVNASRSGSTRLLAAFKARPGSQTLGVPVSRSHRRVAAPF